MLVRYNTLPIAHATSRMMAARLLSTKPLSIKTEIIDNNDREKHNDNKFITHPLFKHPQWTDQDCEAVKFEHRPPVTLGDKIAYNGMFFCRSMFDWVTGYKKGATYEQVKGTRFQMTEAKWLTRVLFLESIAGVPGMTAAFLRHLHSIRLLKRDNAWIETLLDEAYNERMHLLTFMKIGKPSWFTKTFIYVGQGVFCNIFFFMYLLKPRYCHRFVGYLEEEAVSTYTHLIEELNTPNHLPKFEQVQLPEIAWEYWTELHKDSSFKDLILRIRADESKHREVNHTLANLNQKVHRNPYALKIEDLDQPQPTNDLKGARGVGWEKKDLYL